MADRSIGRPFWLGLAACVLAVKILLLAADAQPLFFMGDSAVYVDSALTGDTPLDRSFTYGRFFIGPLLDAFCSLHAVAAVQALASGCSALLLARALDIAFRLPRPALAFAALVYAIEPLGLLYERMMMTECVTLTFWAGFVLTGVAYLRQPRAVLLAMLAALSAALVSLKLAFVPTLMAAPLLLALPAPLPVRSKARHAALGVALTLLTHAAYKQAFGAATGQPAGYEARSGWFLLASWAPLVTPVDLSPPLSWQAIAPSLVIPLSDRHARPSQLFAPGGLVDVLTRAEPDLAAGDAMARRIALHVGRRDPLGVLRLGFGTYLDFWNGPRLRETLAIDEGLRPLDDWVRTPLLRRLGRDESAAAQAPSAIKSYHAGATAWYRLVLLCPALWFARLLVRPAQWRPTLFLAATAAGLLSTNVLLATEAVPRYLHPLAWMTVGALAASAPSRRDCGYSLTNSRSGTVSSGPT